MMNRVFSLATALLPLALAAPAFVSAQSVPTTMNFQGRLAKANGTPVADTASQSLTFRLFDSAAGGNKLWEQALTGNVSVRNGTFAVRLDFASGYITGNTLATVFGNVAFTPYLEIQVGTDAPLAPRQPLASQAYALYSGIALTVPDASITSAKIAPGAVGVSQLAAGLLGPLWNLAGNAGINPAANFLGTTDNQPLVFRTNNSERARLGTNGFFGIGTPTPAAPLHVNASGTLIGFFETGSTSGSMVRVQSNSGVRAYDLLVTGIASPEGAGKLLFRDGTANTVRMTLDTIGNFGIGTVSPIAPLHLIGTFRASGKALIGPSTTLDIPSGYGEALVVDGATRLFGALRVDGTGGLNLTGSGAGLIFPDGTKQTTAFSTTAGGDLTGIFPNPTIAAAKVTSAKLASDAASLNKVSGGVMTSSGGYIGIGTSTPTTPLHVSGTGDFIGFLESSSTGTTRLRLQNNDAARAYDILVSGNSSVFGGGKLVFYDGTSNVSRLTLDNAGNIGIGINVPAYRLDVSGSINASGSVRANGVVLTSDARYKAHVQPLDSSLNTVLALRGVSYDWDRGTWKDRNFPDGRQIGFLAQELEKVLPELVQTDENGYKAVNYVGVIPILVEAVKEQQKQINEFRHDKDRLQSQSRAEMIELRDENAALKAENAEIKARLNAIEKFLQYRKR